MAHLAALIQEVEAAVTSNLTCERTTGRGELVRKLAIPQKTPSFTLAAAIRWVGGISQLATNLGVEGDAIDLLAHALRRLSSR
eukprot:6212517-Pleurochrysis_carterae.AAC.8